MMRQRYSLYSVCVLQRSYSYCINGLNRRLEATALRGHSGGGDTGWKSVGQCVSSWQSLHNNTGFGSFMIGFHVDPESAVCGMLGASCWSAFYSWTVSNTSSIFIALDLTLKYRWICQQTLKHTLNFAQPDSRQTFGLQKTGLTSKEVTHNSLCVYTCIQLRITDLWQETVFAVYSEVNYLNTPLYSQPARVSSQAETDPRSGARFGEEMFLYMALVFVTDLVAHFLGNAVFRQHFHLLLSAVLMFSPALSLLVSHHSVFAKRSHFLYRWGHFLFNTFVFIPLQYTYAIHLVSIQGVYMHFRSSIDYFTTADCLCGCPIGIQSRIKQI